VPAVKKVNHRKGDCDLECIYVDEICKAFYSRNLNYGISMKKGYNNLFVVVHLGFSSTSQRARWGQKGSTLV